MNADFVKQALRVVDDPVILVNIMSQRVRQLAVGGHYRPLVADTGTLGLADVALLEIIERKIGWVMPTLPKNERPPSKKRKSLRADSFPARRL